MNGNTYQEILDTGFTVLQRRAVQIAAMHLKACPNDVDGVVGVYDGMLQQHASEVASVLRRKGYNDRESVRRTVRVEGDARVVESFQREILEQVPVFDEEIMADYRSRLASNGFASHLSSAAMYVLGREISDEARSAAEEYLSSLGMTNGRLKRMKRFLKVKE
jgi:hypothetical protein